MRLCEAMVFADELDIHLLPKVGYAWMSKGTQVEVMTPGTHAKQYLATALHLAAGTLHHGVGPRQADMEDHLDRHGPGKYQLSDLYVEPAVTATGEQSVTEAHAAAACVYQSSVERLRLGIEALPLLSPKLV
jgi:hypothetical protein